MKLSGDQWFYWIQTLTVGLCMVGIVAIMSYCNLAQTQIKAKAGCSLTERDAASTECRR
jgi:hypothetical protein